MGGVEEELISLKIDSSYYNKTNQNLIVDENIIKLTQNEIITIEYFLDNKNKIVSSSDIFYEIWGFDKEYNPNSIRTLIKKIRKKLPLNMIENIYGGSYRFIVWVY